MGFKCGIVGLPNVGKSTLFNALTEACIAAENFPFCTIEPNTGIVPVPDERLQALADIVNPKKIIPATMEFVDIAGLVKGAAKGEGLGNQFLANIRETEAIAHVVRCFEKTDVIHVEGKIDPINDIEIINTELILADLETAQKALHKISKNAKSGNKEAIVEKALMEKIIKHLNEGNTAHSLTLNDKELIFLHSLHLLTAKPVLFIANVDEKGLTNNPLLKQVEDYAEKQNAKVVAICAKFESEMAELTGEEKKEFLSEIGLEEPGLNRVIRAGYELLTLHTFFTAGPQEVRAWTIKKESTAPQAAGKIHTDFEKGFIRAEVIAYDDFIQYKGEHGAKETGKWRLEGKDYIVKDGDVMHFRFNV